MTRIIIDVREPFEYSMGHVDGAINITPAAFMSGGVPAQLQDVEKDTEIILYCLSGARSNVGMHMLRQHGFTNLTNGINKDHVRARYSA